MTKDEKTLVPVITKELTPFSQRVSTISIVDEASMLEAAGVRTSLKDLLKKVVDHKEKKTKPLNQALKEIRAETKPLETAIEDALDTLNRKMTVYQTEAEKKADIERAKIAERVGEGKGHLKPETAVAKMAEVDAPAAQVGGVKFTTARKFEVMDVVILLTENEAGSTYVEANEAAIRKAMYAGIELKGVRYFTEKVPAKA